MPGRFKSSEINIIFGGVEGTTHRQDESHANCNAVGNTRGQTGRRRRYRARTRKARSLGRPLRNPFRTYAESHLKEIAPFRAEETVAEKRRKLRMLERVFSELRDRGLVDSMNPKCFDDQTIGAFVKWSESAGHDMTYTGQMLNHLNGLLRHVGNGTIDNLRQKGLLQTDPGPAPIVPKDGTWVSDAISRLETLDGWDATVVGFAVQIYFGTGLRPKELRLARMADLDTATWWMKVSAPKGLRRWTSGRDRVLIMDHLRPVVQDFLYKREKHLQELGLEPRTVEPLIPNVLGHYYKGPAWNMLRYRTLQKVGLQGDYRILRPSFAKERREDGNDVETVSRMLRHTSVVTTQKFYDRMEATDAWSRAAQRKAQKRTVEITR